MRSISVQFRGTEWLVEIDRDGGYDDETNTHEIEWHFAGLTPADHDALNLTDDEEQEIYEQISLSEHRVHDFT